MQVTRLLESNFPHIMDVTFTAQMEKNLDKVARGESKRDVVLYDFYKDFSHMLSLFAEKKVEKIVEQTDIPCGGENCQEKLVVKLGKSGDFLACPKFPQCTYTSAYERDEKGVVSKVEKVRKILSEECPQCNKPLELKKSKYGEFISCSGYPSCKYTKQQMTDHDCLECGKGKLVRRVWKKGAFWSCQCYPACNFSIPGEIQEQKCPLCSYPFMKKNSKKDGTVFISCASRSCSYSESVDGENEE
jgi:DNA topoisomerase-1